MKSMSELRSSSNGAWKSANYFRQLVWIKKASTEAPYSAIGLIIAKLWASDSEHRDFCLSYRSHKQKLLRRQIPTRSSPIIQSQRETDEFILERYGLIAIQGVVSEMEMVSRVKCRVSTFRPHNYIRKTQMFRQGCSRI